ncbi:uncharacterized protein LOC144702359 [Wolffia australiana]
MATQTPAMIQNENLHIPRGKAIEGGKTAVLKPEKKERKDRKALADLSRPAKPLFSATKKGSTVKGSSLRGGPTLKIAPSKSGILTEDELKKCHEWAKEGIERVHFTGNDIQRNMKEASDKRVKKKVEMVMSSLNKWNLDVYDYALPKRTTEDIGFVKTLELEPEVSLSAPTALPVSGSEEMEDPEIIWPVFAEENFEFKMKESNSEVAAPGCRD